MLSPKQENFAIAVVQGTSQADAYRQSYNSVNMENATIYVEASRLARNPKVSLRIEELLREKDVDRRMQAVKLEDFVLDQLKHESLTARSDSARVRALELQGKTIGLFQMKPTRDEPPLQSSSEIEKELVRRLEKHLPQIFARNITT